MAPLLSAFHPKEFVSLKEEVGEENLIRQEARQIAYSALAVDHSTPCGAPGKPCSAPVPPADQGDWSKQSRRARGS